MTEEQKAIQELKSMSDDELLLVDFDVLKWICSGKKCCRHTKVRDYGIAPEHYHPKMKPKWMDMNLWYYLCPTHFKLFRRLLKNFPEEKVREKVCDFEKPRLLKTEK